MIFAQLGYHYGFTVEQVLALTLPQLKAYVEQLGQIMKQIYGGGEEESDADFLSRMNQKGIPTPGKR